MVGTEGNVPCEVDIEDEEDEEEDYYYGYQEENAIEPPDVDPEKFPVEILTSCEAVAFVEAQCRQVCDKWSISMGEARALLKANEWDLEKINAMKIPSKMETEEDSSSAVCGVCCSDLTASMVLSLPCRHSFCQDCWITLVKTKIMDGDAVECMAFDCSYELVREDVHRLPLDEQTSEQYERFAVRMYVQSHPLLTYCVGVNCEVIFKGEKAQAKRVKCGECEATFCFKCGQTYHAPTDCTTLRIWLRKCQEDKATALYFTKNTKDCPKCDICIEKNGGCNHMQCAKCRHEFCWMCLREWQGHGGDYYGCSSYRAAEGDVGKSVAQSARSAMSKYLHYFQRWENHAQSLRLEQQTVEKIRKSIQDRVAKGPGTWIDWQYLFDAADRLAKCRYTLQYTYPYAYFMESKSKQLFEYQQARLEAEIENLSWKIERAESTDRADLENQMYIAEKWKKTLLMHFFDDARS